MNVFRTRQILGGDKEVLDRRADEERAAWKERQRAGHRRRFDLIRCEVDCGASPRSCKAVSTSVQLVGWKGCTPCWESWFMSIRRMNAPCGPWEARRPDVRPSELEAILVNGFELLVWISRRWVPASTIGGSIGRWGGALGGASGGNFFSQRGSCAIWRWYKEQRWESSRNLLLLVHVFLSYLL